MLISDVLERFYELRKLHTYYMRLTVRQLRRIIREAIAMPDDMNRIASPVGEKLGNDDPALATGELQESDDNIKFFCDDARHLVCVPYTVENLHKMAQQLDIKQCWFHKGASYPHYDIPKRRITEISEKCNKVSTRTILEIVKGKFGVTEALGFSLNDYKPVSYTGQGQQTGRWKKLGPETHDDDDYEDRRDDDEEDWPTR